MTTQMTNAVNAAIPSRMKAFVGVERSRSAPGRTRDGPATEGESGSEVPTEGVPVTGDEHPAEPKSASSPPVAVMHLPSEIMVPTTSAAHPGASTVNITVPAIIVQDESSSLTPQSTGSVRTTQPASGVPVHVQMQVPTDAAARRVSPAPSMLSEAILLERRRRAVAAAMSGVHTPVGDNSSNPSVATAPAAVPTPKDVEERLAGLGPRAKGARYKSSPLVAPEPGKVATAPGVAAAQTQNTGIPPTEERKED
ncbi:hypothetical protein CALCODRAFT_450505 [Calocera cornea HHB12733]|uniref:Uncharacterized protein n=1 Tax=Calocera cornea HHB12733 TaxID=1353952 RepID=A0A165HE17_9BASI|nr:hypothetical protein CALCODRAFT_450505 [Calocera cornea HHB12733]